MDGTETLCKELYGRPEQARDYIGGSEAQMLYDAAAKIAELKELLCMMTPDKEAYAAAQEALGDPPKKIIDMTEAELKGLCRKEQEDGR